MVTDSLYRIASYECTLKCQVLTILDQLLQTVSSLIINERVS